ncbi:MAG: rhomboid family intramembrane serine protease [Actinomycetaceae bacterium]|nr:rhomboid family intramembrane serine protease [Actinomycetaceae bacterium]
MTDLPRYGQRSDPAAAPACPRHPSAQSVDYCKKCNRPMCVQCAIRTDVRSICVDCSSTVRQRIQPRGTVVTFGLIALCVGIFLIGLVSDGLWRLLAFAPDVGAGQPWRFLTTAFLHSGLWHLGFNMLALYWVGQSLEKLLGHWRFAAIYLLSAIGGTLMVLAWVLVEPGTWMQVTVGASGAVLGLFGAVLTLQRQSGLDTRQVAILIGINVVIGFLVPNVSWQAHLGGALVGAATAWALTAVGRPRAGVTARTQEIRSIGTAAGIAVAQLGLIALLYMAILEIHG